MWNSEFGINGNSECWILVVGFSGNYINLILFAPLNVGQKLKESARIFLVLSLS